MLNHEEAIEHIYKEVERLFDLPKDEALRYTAFVLDSYKAMRNVGMLDDSDYLVAREVEKATEPGKWFQAIRRNLQDEK